MAVPGLLIGIEVPEHGQGARLAGRRAQSHDGTAADQHPGIGRQRTQHRTRAEHPGTHEHDLLSAELVAHHPEGQHRAGEGQRVRADYPLQGQHARVQVRLHAAEPDAHDRVVQERQEEQRTQDGQRNRSAATLRHGNTGDAIPDYRHLTSA
jgi:hypothetical protein